MGNLFLVDSDLVRYFTDFYEEDGFFLQYNNKKYLYVDDRYYHAAKQKVLSNVEVNRLDNEKGITEILKELKVDKVGLYNSFTPLDIYLQIKDAGVETFDAKDDIIKLISIKNEREIEFTKKSCEIAEKSFIETIEFIKENKEDITEKRIAAFLEYRFISNGAESIAFPTIVAFGENAAIPHHMTSDRKLKNNECILMDFGCKYHGYCSDITRTLYFGKPNNEFVEAYNAVLKAQNAAENKIFNGISAKCADKIARDILLEYNLNSYFTHSLGHGIGLKIHEGIRLSQKSNDMLVEGNIFSIEPGVYLNDKFGIRIENTVLLTKDGVKSLVSLDKNLNIIC